MWWVYKCEDCGRLWIDPGGVPLKCSNCASKDREQLYVIENPRKELEKYLNEEKGSNNT